MRIIITENQWKSLLEGRSEDDNFKTAEEFDKLFGTDLSHKYDLSPYTEDEIWGYFVKCRSGDDDGCKLFKKSFMIIPKAFPYIDTTKLNNETKKDIMLGMVSGYNPEDIYHFSINKVPAYRNVEQKKLEHELPYEVVRHLQR